MHDEGERTMKDTVLLEEMSWPEVAAALAAGTRTVVVMTASIEQHGPHLPLLTDTGIGYAVGERVARGLGNALLAPVIRPGCSDHHLAFPGSLSIPESVFIETVVACVRSLAPHGFDTFVLLSSHGGNFSGLEKAAARLRAELGQHGTRIVDFAGRQALLDTMRVMLEAAAAMGVVQDVDAVHAEVTETSIMMRRYPKLVDTSRLEQGRMGRIDNDALFRDGLKAITANGILGDARGATVEIGDAVLTRLSDHIVASVRRQLAAR
jgi:creatinine amidohydrolase